MTTVTTPGQPTPSRRRRRRRPADDDLAFLSATELVALLADGAVSSRELVEVYLDRAAHADSANAVVTVDVDGARRRADRADAARRRGDAGGPLHGLPVTVKDTIDTAGIRTTSGLPEFADRVPERDAESVARLKAAGAVVFGKTNVPAGGVDLQTYNDVFGATVNPWDPSRTAGGSSGGAAAALATGVTALDIGSDIGGSIRVPSHFCGVYGHKPTHGLVPNAGGPTAPVGFRAEPDISVTGPLGRQADDVALALRVLIEPDAGRGPGWQARLAPPRRRTSDYRVGVWADDPACPVDDATRGAVEQAADAMAAAGASVVRLDPPPVPFAEAADNYFRLFYAALAGSLRFPPAVARMAGFLPGESDAVRAVKYSSASHRDWLVAHERREALRQSWATAFESVDVVLCPVAPCPAIPHDTSFSGSIPLRSMTVEGRRRSYMDLFAWCGVVGAAYLPATVAPVADGPDGLPIGVQVVGPYLGDLVTIDVAGRLGRLTRGYQRPPG